jgi:ADP-heptose:LPS heptosyltransferase
MRLSSMGDVAMTVPVLRALVQQYPELRVTVISRPFFKPFFDTIPQIHFVAFDPKTTHKGLLGLGRLYWQLSSLSIDAFGDMHNVLRSKIIRAFFALSGKKTAALDKGRAEKKVLTRLQNKQFFPLTAMVNRQASVLEKLGFPIDLSKPTFPPKFELTPETTALVGTKTKPWIGLAPFAQYQGKVYPLDLMKKLIDQLDQSGKYELFLLGGGAKEIALLKQFSEQTNHTNVVAGQLSLAQEMALMSEFDVLVSMDSANGHMGALLGIPVITLWGATHPYAGFTPFHQPERNSLCADRNEFPGLPTSVYGNKIVPGYADAMRTILPETIFAKIQEIIAI